LQFGKQEQIEQPHQEVVKLKIENEGLKAKIQHMADTPKMDAELLWKYTSERNAEKIAHKIAMSRIQVEVPGGPIGFTVVADQHITSGCVDMQQMLDDALLIRNTPNLYCVLGGDGFDNHIKHRAAIISKGMSPQDEVELYDYYLEILQDKILGIVTGNHEAWAMAMAGVDVVKNLAEKHRIAYAGDDAEIDLILGNQAYKILVRHQFMYESSLNVGNAVKRMWDMGPTPFDIGVICHKHTPLIEEFYRHGLKRIALRPGSYQISSGFTSQLGFPRSIPTCPTVILSHRERELIPFSSLRAAVDHLKVKV
jgi:hypothetical protein